ncbi:TspO/MBR family protein [Sphingomonas turrisvirgatae]|uniref:CrtK protein n=1 Tax=Sphingomonas turrisvirgatae TaxID=1888892 RepID=A0A1E3LZW8_9SPHN|nr:TspO/MBR family protein [Sphingomonas turrisvirgatae]ODP38635.1 CrtK protein [Sphingomonas turrisvirgatae]
MEIASKGQLRLAFLRWAIVTVPLILLLGFASGRLVPSGEENTWYQLLQKPAVTPPGWVFPVAWSIIYVLMGLALAIVINARGSRLRRPALILFALQLAANLAWTPLFFGAHQLFWALVLIVAIFLVALATTLMFGRIRRAAAWAMVPYLAWLCFAGTLNYQIHRLNPNAVTLVPGGQAPQINL